MDTILGISEGDASLIQTSDVSTILKTSLLNYYGKQNLSFQKRIHPQIIIVGWRDATNEARQALLNSAVDHDSDEDKFCQYLMTMAGTTLSSKLHTHHKDHFTKLAVEAVL
ncbi:hypothetical protein QTO34_012599 [Cnephaeus nilssonii]|uniref:Uncharacterized protein n=1 Tax=Cnephaeus nilssonii TaxID=3371016 RepID=A0AA40HCK5_CNENI|nr:hypothetical protein QTO34_012599 [Eptesicus nilssonii]